eukprot:Skav213392  [mRNA]  locus=scaffold797:419450:423227:+ [translate_table: standard]
MICVGDAPLPLHWRCQPLLRRVSQNIVMSVKKVYTRPTGYATSHLWSCMWIAIAKNLEDEAVAQAMQMAAMMVPKVDFRETMMPKIARKTIGISP